MRPIGLGTAPSRIFYLGLDRGSFSLVIALSLLLYGAFMPLAMPSQPHPVAGGR